MGTPLPTQSTIPLLPPTLNSKLSMDSLDPSIPELDSSEPVQNAVQLATYARNVLEARAAICADFARTYFNHVRRYNSVRLTIAELSNTFDEEYKDFESFLQKKMSESQ